jgi:hypothetical protein
LIKVVLASVGIFTSSIGCTHSGVRTRVDPPVRIKTNADEPKAPDAVPGDGPVYVDYNEIYKYGSTESSKYDLSTRPEIPRIPNGYALHGDLTFKIVTTAVVSGRHIVKFHLPSIDSAEKFANLSIFHLEPYELSPSQTAWTDRTIIPEQWNDGMADSIKKEKFQSYGRDFARREISALASEVGIFAIVDRATASETSTAPFTKIELSESYSAAEVKIGSDFALTITIKNAGPEVAGEIDLENDPDSDNLFVASKSSQGQCRQSDKSTNRVICNLGALAPGGIATVHITMRVFGDPATAAERRIRRNVTMAAFKKDVNDLYDYRNLVRSESTVTSHP